MANSIFLASGDDLKGIEPGDLKGIEIYFDSGDNNRVVVGKSSTFNKVSVRISGNGNTVRIGDKVSLNNLNILLNGGYDFRKVTIGRLTYAGGGLIQAVRDFSEIIFGDDCMLSTGISVINNMGINISDRQSGELLNKKTDIHIGDHVRLGKSSYIDGGSVIASDCIVDMRSFVTGRFLQSYCLIAGNPAKVVARNVNFIKCHIDDFDENIGKLAESKEV